MPDFCSGATNRLGCFIEGFSLRRVHPDHESGSSDLAGHTPTTLMIVEALESAATCRTHRFGLEQVLIGAVPQHLPFGLCGVRIFDANPQVRRIEYMLQTGQVLWVRCPSAQAPETPAGQRRVDGDKAVFAHIERYRMPLMVPLQAGCSRHAECNENQRSSPLRGLLDTWGMSIVIELKMIEPTANAVREINLLVGVAADGLADHKWLLAGCNQIDCANEAVEPAG